MKKIKLHGGDDSLMHARIALRNEIERHWSARNGSPYVGKVVREIVREKVNALRVLASVEFATFEFYEGKHTQSQIARSTFSQPA